MCGRFIITSVEKKVANHIPGVKTGTWRPPNKNVCPTQEVPVIRNDGRLAVDWVRWGLIPHWAKDPKIGARMINARAETLAEKPSFRTPLQRQRCLILADGFYEWRTDPETGKRKPVRFAMKSGDLFAFAGLWDSWKTEGGQDLLTCTIITTTPNELVQPIHDRMPAILLPRDYERWLSPQPPPVPELLRLLGPYPAGEMEAEWGVVIGNQ